MKPLVVLISVFAIFYSVIYFVPLEADYKVAMRLGMSIMLLFTATGHFAFTKGMAMMLPRFVPAKNAVVYLTGLLEIVFAAGLVIADYAQETGLALIIFFILILPANLYAAYKQVDYQKGTHNGSGLTYLWFRVPLQLLFIMWVYISTQ
ncbi:MAG: hypothetical protein EOP46_13290 [Sphingobacteriaceae bacterium]|nr:MAG: hypothetical protein EOP46_13290 [Sphingobacteriaceae bacterium]